MDCKDSLHRVSFISTLEDVAKTHSELARRRSGRKSRLKGWTILTWGGLAFGLIVHRESDSPWLEAIIFVVLPLQVIYGVLLWLGPVLMKSQLTYYWGPGPYSVGVELTDAQLISHFDDLEQRFLWGAVKELQLNQEEMRIFIGTYGLQRLPLCHFENQEQADDWRRFIEHKTGRQFVST